MTSLMASYSKEGWQHHCSNAWTANRQICHVRALWRDLRPSYWGCSLATKVVHARYCWPTLKVNTHDFTRRCRRCQEFVDILSTPPNNLHSLGAPWPIAMWGMDILGPLSKAPRAIKFLLVAISYFTKWIDARPLREISANEVEKFTWKHLICRYGLPYAIITANDTQFKAQAYEEFLMRLGVKHLVTSVRHP